MEAKYDFVTWQEFLGQVIKNPQERQRLARAAQVKQITLRRWVKGESHPREENVHRLVRALSPDVSSHFLPLIAKEFPSLKRENIEGQSVISEIASELYSQALETYAKTPHALARQQLQDLILGQAIQQLDPDKLGMSVTLVCCIPPRPGEKVRSLRQIGGVATPPWEKDQESRTIFLGAESVAGSAVINYRTTGIESRDSVTFAPAHWTRFENSAIASPILRQARIAGALLASSSQPFFFKQAHRDLLELYAHLAVLIFDPSEFYDLSEIRLGIMPDLELQEPYFLDFERRVSLKYTEASIQNTSLTSQQARQSVWQDLADEFLQMPRQR